MVLIGGVERVIEQVEIFGGSVSDDILEEMTVGEIIDKSRADKLVKKVHQKRIAADNVQFAKGGINAMEVEEVPKISKKILNSKKDSFNKAKEIEQQLAAEAARLSSVDYY